MTLCCDLLFAFQRAVVGMNADLKVSAFVDVENSHARQKRGSNIITALPGGIIRSSKKLIAGVRRCCS